MQYMSKPRRMMSKAPPPTAMPTMAPVLRMGEGAAVAEALVVDTTDEEAVVEVDVGRDVVELGDADVVEIDVLDDAIGDDVDDGTAVMVAARKVASFSLSVIHENQRSVGELEAIQVCQ